MNRTLFILGPSSASTNSWCIRESKGVEGSGVISQQSQRRTRSFGMLCDHDEISHSFPSPSSFLLGTTFRSRSAMMVLHRSLAKRNNWAANESEVVQGVQECAVGWMVVRSMVRTVVTEGRAGDEGISRIIFDTRCADSITVACSFL